MREVGGGGVREEREAPNPPNLMPDPPCIAAFESPTASAGKKTSFTKGRIPLYQSGVLSAILEANPETSASKSSKPSQELIIFLGLQPNIL